MTTATVQIANIELPFIEYQGQPVVTFAMIDAAHKRPKNTATRTFHKNKRHMIEGEDFYPIDSKGLYEIRRIYPELFPEAMNRVTFFTETGYLMLVKSFTDDLAWQVQRQLVKGYFQARRAWPKVPDTVAPQPAKIDHAQRRELTETADALFQRHGMARDSGGQQWLYNRLRIRFSIRRIEDLPAEDFTEAMAIVRAQNDVVSQLGSLMHHLRYSFYTDVVGGGEQWTSWLSKQIGGAHVVPDRPDWRKIASQVLEHHRVLPTRH
ncbi:ORF6N domain-containing protein [Salinicola sp. CPA57]|uniref:ORF6N domain-containing protein n=1 Tax=Salinicola sp. CPA57 TaxID=1949080 RepID=UPI000DA1D636|nr:ORF6N domain-containing protein [Salinicola sp. CPA57]